MIARSIILRACLIIIAAAVCTSTADAQRRPIDPAPRSPSTTGVGNIVGRVLLPSGYPAALRYRVSVVFSDNTVLVTYTDSNGEFTFTAIPEGNHTLEVQGDSKVYETLTERISVMRGSRNPTTLYLKEKGSTGEKKPDGNLISAAELSEKIPPPAKKEFDKAMKMLNAGNAEKAIEHLKQAIALHPTYLMAYNDLGVQYLRLRQWDAAMTQFQTAIDINPRVFNPRLNLGIALIEQKKFAEALVHLKEAVAINSSQPAAHFYVGLASLNTGALDDAQNEMEKALALGGDEYMVARYFLAQVYIKKNRRDDAIRELKVYLEKAPESEQKMQVRSLMERLQAAGK